MIRSAWIRAVLFVGLILIFACSGGKMDERKSSYGSISDVPESAWKKLAEQRIYFGHQSVGQNIMAGVADLLRSNPQIKLRVVESKEERTFDAPCFAHSTIGSNGNPRSKIEAFTALMDKGVGKSTNIAFFKFCYIDFNSSTEVENLFKVYKQSMVGLKTRYQKTTFIHVTVPLMVLQTGPKAWIKSLLGKPISGYEDNILRCRFNDLLRQEYEGKAPIFDLASLESTYPDGRRASFEKEGKVYYYLVEDYTYDDGHLNEKGRKNAAEHLLALLAGL